MRKIKLLAIASILSILPLSGCEARGGESKNIDTSSSQNVSFGTLYVATLPNQTIFNVGEAFTSEGLKVINGSTGAIVIDYELSIKEGQIFLDSGEYNVVISARGYESTSYKINVVNLPKLVIKSYPKIEYEVQDYFSLEGLVLTNQDDVVINNYTCNYSTSNRLYETGTFEVVLSSEGYYPAKYNIVVYPQYALVVDHLPNKVTYEIGETFTSEGLIIKDNRKGEIITSYTLSMQEGVTLKVSGIHTVSVSCSGYISTSFNIVVNASQGGEVKDDMNLKIYYVNDVHGAYSRYPSENQAGMTHLGKTLKDLKDADPEHTLILAGGDMYQGGLESNATGGAIIADAMNYIGFDAMCLGNHEFDWGEKKMQSTIEMCNFPVLSANTFYYNGDYPTYLSPYTIVDKGGFKVGIIGAARNNMGSSIDSTIAEDFSFPNPVNYVKKYSDELRLNYGCDAVILVAHDEGFDGYTYSSSTKTSYYDCTQFSDVTSKKYVDAMFFAHDHTGKTGVENGVPFLEAYSNTKYYGTMTLKYSYAFGSYDLAGYEKKLINAYQNCTEADPYIVGLMDKYSDIIGDPDEVICNFTTSYNQTQVVKMTCQAMVWFVNSRPSTFKNVTAYVGYHNNAGIRASISTGQFTRRDLYKVCPFDNALCVGKSTSKQVNYMTSSTQYNNYYVDGTPVYSGNYTNTVTISYLANSRYSYNYIGSYDEYEQFTAKDALYYFLKSGASINV